MAMAARKYIRYMVMIRWVVFNSNRSLFSRILFVSMLFCRCCQQLYFAISLFSFTCGVCTPKMWKRLNVLIVKANLLHEYCTPQGRMTHAVLEFTLKNTQRERVRRKEMECFNYKSNSSCVTISIPHLSIVVVTTKRIPIFIS